MKYLPLILVAVAIAACNSKKNEHIFDITDYGAVGDSATLNSAFIQKAIDACAKKGGGIVVFPAGKFVTGTIVLRSNIEYHFDNGAMLIGSTSIEHYNKPEGESNVMLISNTQQVPPVQQALRVLLDGSGIENVSFTGHGIIEGNGKYFWDAEFKALERPEPWINFKNSKNISFRDITFQNSPSHVLRFANSEQIVIDGIKIFNVPKSPNTDGIDIVDSHHVSIVNSFISTGDDAICLKSEDEFVENVVVTNCIIESDDAAIKFGTGSRTGMRFNSFTNCVIRKSRYGISLFMLEGGLFEQNNFSNLVMEGGSRHEQEYAIFIDVDKKRPTDGYGFVRNNSFSNLKISTTGKIMVTGRPEIAIESIHFNNITFHLTKEADFSGAKKPRGNKNFPNLETSIDRAPIPAHFTFAYINGLYLDNVSITYDFKSKRKDVDLLEVKDLRVTNCRGNDISRLK
jgi:polygalacturonase